MQCHFFVCFYLHRRILMHNQQLICVFFARLCYCFKLCCSSTDNVVVKSKLWCCVLIRSAPFKKSWYFFVNKKMICCRDHHPYRVFTSLSFPWAKKKQQKTPNPSGSVKKAGLSSGLYLAWPVSIIGRKCVRCWCWDSLDEGAYWLFTVLTRVCLPLQACLAC